MREYRSSSPAAWNRFFPLSGIAIVLLLFGLSGGLIGLSGCKGFFVSQGSGSGGTGGSGGTTAVGNNFYVANGSNTYLAGLSVSSTGALAVLPNAPYNNGVAATSLAITPDNNYLYVATANGIYEYAISSNGSIAVQNNGQPLAQDVIATTLKVDSTGNYLLAAGLGTATGTPAIGIYQIGSGGGITAESGSPLALYSGPAGSTPSATLATGMLITPNNAYVYVSLGDLGVQVLTLGSGGALSTGSAPTILSPFSKSSSPSDYGLASDPNSKYLFVSELNTGLRVLSIGTGGGLNEISGSPYTTGTGPKAVTVDPTGSYVYVMNYGSNNITGYSLNTTSGQLTAISGSPFASGGQAPVAMVSDNTKKYMAVINSGSNGSSGNNDLQIFSYSTTTPGALVAGATASTGTDPTNPQAVVATFASTPAT